MINFGCAKSYCREDISLIENYYKAISDTEQTWDCHHRRELETSRKELLELGEYFNRPANELIFLTHSEHRSLHNKGVLLSEEHKQKISVAMKGKNTWMKGKKIWLGKHHSEETKQKMSATKVGMLWFNNGIIAVRAKSCPEGFVRGRLKKAI